MTCTELNLYSNTNWLTANGIEDSDMLDKYMASFYWATVTCTTVGYGDILPTTMYELYFAMIIIVFGVAVFAFILSNLSSQFSEITKDSADDSERTEQIEEMDEKFKLGPELVGKLNTYFSNYNTELEFETD